LAERTAFSFKAAYWDPFNTPPQGAWLFLNEMVFPLRFQGFLHDGYPAMADYAHGAIYGVDLAFPVSMTNFYGEAWMAFQPTGGGEMWLGPYDIVCPNMIKAVTSFTAEPAGGGLTLWGTGTLDFNLVPDISPYMVFVEAPSIGVEVVPLYHWAGSFAARSYPLPLTYAPGQTTQTTIRWRHGRDGPGAAQAETLQYTHTWPDRIWKGTSGEIHMAASSVYGEAYWNFGYLISADGEISAVRGRSTDLFLYRVMCGNPWHEPMSSVQAVIDGSPRSMTLVGQHPQVGWLWIYEYETTLPAQSEPHTWRVIAQSRTVTVETNEAQEPWVADVALSEPSVARVGSRRYRFRVRAVQTAGQGECDLIVRQGTNDPPCILVPMTLVDGDLRTGALYQVAVDHLETRSVYRCVWNDGTYYWHDNLDWGGIPKLGRLEFTYQFAFRDRFDGAGTVLAPFLQNKRVLTAPKTFKAFLRHCDRHSGYGIEAQPDNALQVCRVAPGDAAASPLVLPAAGFPRGGMSWSPSGDRLALIGGTGYRGALQVYTNDAAGQLILLREAAEVYNAVCGWVSEDTVLVERRDADGATELGYYDIEGGQFCAYGDMTEPPGGGVSPFLRDRALSYGGYPVGPPAWHSPVQRLQVLCTDGEVDLETETGGSVPVAAGQQSTCDPAAGDTAPGAAEDVAYPYVSASAAAAPGASSALVPPGDADFCSAAFLLQGDVPSWGAVFAGEADTACPSPLLQFALSVPADTQAVAQAALFLGGTTPSNLLAGTLADLAAQGHLRYSASGHVVSVQILRALPPEDYLASLRTAGLGGAGGAAPGGASAGYFRVTEGLGAGGGVFTMPWDGARIQVPAGALDTEAAFDMTFAPGLAVGAPTGCDFAAAPVAVAWTPPGTMRADARFVFDVPLWETATNREFVVGTRASGTWRIVASLLSEEGMEMSAPLREPGVFALFSRTRLAPDAVLRIGGEADAVAPGGTLGIWAEVLHRCGRDIRNAQLSCTLPAGVAYVAGSASNGGAYDPGARAVRWATASIAPGTLLRRTARIAVPQPAALTGIVVTASLAADNLSPTLRTTGTVARIRTSAALEVYTDCPEAHFTLTGSGAAAGTTYTGGGTSWHTEDADPGTYTLAPDAVDGWCAAAWSAPKSAAAGETATFRIDYHPDVDGNGLDDAWTARYFGPDAAVDPDGDTDGDGADNRSEFLAGTSPIDPESVPAIREVAIRPDGMPEVTVRTEPGRQYRIERADGLEDPPAWTPVDTPVLEGNGRSQDAADNNPLADRRFYRVRVRRLP
jgi:hypothetical protein